MDTEDKLERNLRSVFKQDHHELIQQYRKAMHLHGDPSQSENETDFAMQESIALSESPLTSDESLIPSSPRKPR
jgi:predicted glycosyltransferase